MQKMSILEYANNITEYNLAEILDDQKKIAISFEAEFDVNRIIEYITNFIKSKTASFQNSLPSRIPVKMKRYEYGDISIYSTKYEYGIEFDNRLRFEFVKPNYDKDNLSIRDTIRYIENIGGAFILLFTFKIEMGDNTIIIDFYPSHYMLKKLELKYDLNSFETPCYINELVKLLNFWKKTVYEIFEK